MEANKQILIAGLVFVGVIVFIASFLLVYAFYLSVPEYDDQYFTSEYLDKYASVENTFEHFVNAIVTGNTPYYQEVIGRTMTEEEIDESKPYVGKKPTIAKIVRSKNHAYVVTDSNWGQHFEKVKGRWVFTPEDYGVLVRDIFK